MSKLTQVVYQDLPDYTTLITETSQTNAKTDVGRLIKKINKANGGDKE